MVPTLTHFLMHEVARFEGGWGVTVRQPSKDSTGHLVARVRDLSGNLLELREAPARERRL